MQERTKPIWFDAWKNSGGDSNGTITFDGVNDCDGGFDASSGTYTVPEDGIYIFGLRARSGEALAGTQIHFYKNDDVDCSVVSDGNKEDTWNNLGTAWMSTLEKGDKIYLNVDGDGTVDEYLGWYGVRIFATN